MTADQAATLLDAVKLLLFLGGAVLGVLIVGDR